MQFVNGLFSKILWGLLVVVLLAGGYIFLVRNLVKPPQIATTPTQPNPTSPPTPIPSNSSSSQVDTDDFNPTLVDGTDSDSNSSTDVEDMLPALAQAEDVVLEMPQKLEPGGILKYYLNTDDARYPDSIKYSPVEVYKTEGLELVSVERNSNNFQEVEGYFRVKETGYYNFLVNVPQKWKGHDLDSREVKLKIDGFVLPSTLGGKVYLEKGWHKIAFFLNLTVDGDYPTITWAEEGEVAKPLKVWREVVEKETETVEERPQELVTSEE